MALIEKLAEIQARDGLRDKEMAARLGAHPVAWNRLKNGRGGAASRELMEKAVRAFPEVSEAVLEDIFGPDYMRIAKPIFERKLAELFAEGRG